MLTYMGIIFKTRWYCCLLFLQDILIHLSLDLLWVFWLFFILFEFVANVIHGVLHLFDAKSPQFTLYISFMITYVSVELGFSWFSFYHVITDLYYSECSYLNIQLNYAPSGKDTGMRWMSWTNWAIVIVAMSTAHAEWTLLCPRR